MIREYSSNGTNAMAGIRQEGMTTAALKIFRIIERFIEENGYPPTMRELAKDSSHGSSSLSSIQMHIQRLEDCGYISRKFKTARSLRILKQYNEAN